ncbi:peptidase inhibitor family I36 protein [Streptomyces sp. NPDC002446]
MRIRTALAAATGALALVVALPTSASAAEGHFQYTYTGLDGTPQIAVLEDPESWGCVTLPEVADPGASSPAHSPRNRTDEFATVYTGPNCDGDSFTLRPHTGYGSERLKLRSVMFAPFPV